MQRETNVIKHLSVQVLSRLLNYTSFLYQSLQYGTLYYESFATNMKLEIVPQPSCRPHHTLPVILLALREDKVAIFSDVLPHMKLPLCVYQVAIGIANPSFCRM